MWWILVFRSKLDRSRSEGWRESPFIAVLKLFFEILCRKILLPFNILVWNFSPIVEDFKNRLSFYLFTRNFAKARLSKFHDVFLILFRSLKLLKFNLSFLFEIPGLKCYLGSLLKLSKLLNRNFSIFLRFFEFRHNLKEKLFHLNLFCILLVDLFLEKKLNQW